MPKFRGATYFNLKGGINTEASPLNIPPTDAIDAVNIDINIDGSIQRRRSFDFLGASESGNLYTTSPIADYSSIFGSNYLAEVPSMHEFNPVDSNNRIYKHLITHIGNRLYIYDYSSASLLKDFDDPKQTISSSSYSSKQALYHTTLLNNGQRAYLVNRFHHFGYIEYNSSTDTFSFTEGDVQHRVDNGTSAPITNVLSDTSGWLIGALSNSRVWLAGATGYPNTVFFSQIIVNGDEYVKMYQEADPYAVSDNALVATDGGTITITGAEKIMALATLGNGILVLANNGIWYIGGSNGFNPLNYSINKISDSGIVGTTSWCLVEQQLVYFGENDIYTILQGTSLETPEVRPIGNKAISLYNSITLYNKEAGVAVYEPNLKKVFFFTNFDSELWQVERRYDNHHSILRDALVFDVRLAAWSKYSLSSDSDGDKVSIGYAAILSGGRIDTAIVTDSSGATVTDSLGEDVTVQDSTITNSNKVLNLLYQKKSGNTWKIGIGELTETGLIDFENSSADSESNSSYITGSYQIFNDVAHRKFTGYLIPIFQRIESGILDANGEDITPGGCKYRVDYNWAINSNSKNFGILRDAYIPYKYITSKFDGGDTGDEIVSSRLKLRGSGSSFKVHFESDGDKDFKLYGWQIMINTKPRI